MSKSNKIYLMAAGTFLPAFTGLFIMKAINKDAIKFDTKEILIFSGLALIGGYVTAKALKG